MRSTFETAYRVKYGRGALIKLRRELFTYCNENNIYPDDMGFQGDTNAAEGIRGPGCFKTEDLIVIRNGLEEPRRIEAELVAKK